MREKFFMTRCEYIPVRSTAASLLPTVIKNSPLIWLNTPSACGGVVYYKQKREYSNAFI